MDLFEPTKLGRLHLPNRLVMAPEHMAGWRRVKAAVRAPMFLQLQHGGRIGHPDNSGLVPLAPSPIPLPDTMVTPYGEQAAVVPREMTVPDLRTTVADFAAAARNAITAGFAGVEVHAANGYLLHQFLAAGTTTTPTA